MAKAVDQLVQLLKTNGRVPDPEGERSLLTSLMDQAGPRGLGPEFPRRAVKSALETADPRSALPDQALVAAQGWEVYLDSEAVGSACVLRPRRPGDRFCPLGMGGRSKRVNEFMINEKIPASWREHIPLLVNEEERIVWVCGWRPDERACVSDSTQQVVWLRFERT